MSEALRDRGLRVDSVTRLAPVSSHWMQTFIERAVLTYPPRSPYTPESRQ
jgi:hypothetical protein